MHLKFLYLGLAITSFCSANLGNRRRALLPRYTADYLEARDVGSLEHARHRRDALADTYLNALNQRNDDSSVDEEADLLTALRRRTGTQTQVGTDPSRSRGTSPPPHLRLVGDAGASGIANPTPATIDSASAHIDVYPHQVQLTFPSNIATDVLRNYWHERGRFQWPGYTVEPRPGVWRFTQNDGATFTERTSIAILGASLNLFVIVTWGLHCTVTRHDVPGG